MPLSSLDSKRRRLVVLGGLLLLMACTDGGQGCEGGCGEGGCALGASVPYPAAGAVVDQAAQVRLTPQGLEFVEENAGPLVTEMLPDGLSFCIPPGNVLVDYCHDPSVNDCGSQGAGCMFDAEIDHVELTPFDAGGTNPDRLDVRVVLTGIKEFFPFGDCKNLVLVSDAFRVDLSVIFHLDDDDRTWLEVGDIVVHLEDLEPVNACTSDDPDIQTECSDGQQLACGGVVVLFQTALALGPFLSDFIAGPIEEGVEDQLCLPCDSGCPDGTSCDADTGVCRYNSGICVPLPLGMEGALDLGAQLAGMTTAENAILNYLFYLANYADAENNGMSLGAQAGFHAEYDACVPRRDPPDTRTVPKSGDLVSGLTPSGGTYMVGVGISRRILNLALWAVYNSGAMCLSVGSDTVEQLTSGTLAIILDSLNELTEEHNVPMFIQVRPTQPPYVELGSGEVLSGDPPTIVDPLVTVRVEDLKIDFFAWVEERYVRIFTLDTDIAMPIALTPSDDGTGIQVLLGDLEDAFERIDPVDAELLAQEDVDQLADVLPGLVAGLLPSLLSQLDEPFALPAFAGYRLEVNQDSFTSIEDSTMLAIFANLAPDTETTPPAIIGVPQAVATLLSVEGPTADDIADFESRRSRDGVIDIDELRSRITLAVETPGDDSAEREYTYRIDGGPWHLYRPGDQLVLTDPDFLIEGRHEIAVRSRIPGTSGSMSLVSEPVEVVIDLASPRVEIRRSGGREIEIEASDNVWPDHELTMRSREDGGEWSPVGPVGPIALPAPSAVDRSVELEVEVFDPAGRSTLVRRTYLVRAESVTPAVDEEPEGCAVAGRPSGAGSTGWLALLAGLAWLIRRRARKVPPARRSVAGSGLVALAAIALALAACSDEPSSGPNDQQRLCDEGCADDELCIDGVCVENVCESDDECPGTMACTDGHCVLRIRCTTDLQCPDGLFCIDDDDDGGSECLSVPCEGDGDCSWIDCRNGKYPYCLDGACACELPCPEGCGEGEFCCRPTSSCETLPTACGELDCDVGYEPGIVTPAEGNPDSCEVTGPACDCLELPPLPIGDVGAYLSSDAGPDGTIYVSAFNRTYEDLMFGVVGADGTVDWTFLDGVPDTGTVTGSLSGPRGGIADPGNRVGRYTSLAVADDGTVHVTYFDRTNRNLRYARGVPKGSGGYDWAFSTIDETDWSGLYTSITLSATGVPGVAYFVQRAEVEPGVWHGQLRYAWADAAEPTAWTIELVDSRRLSEPCGGRCFGSASCHAETNTCDREGRASDCSPACGGSQACFETDEGGGVCGTVIANPALWTLDGGTGLFADSARFADGDVAVAWYDHNAGNLLYAASDGSSFAGVSPVILDGQVADGPDDDTLPDDTGDVGRYPSVMIDGDGGVHVTYVDVTNGDLRYVDLSNGVPEIVDAGVRGTSEEVQRFLVGDDSSLVALPDGTLQVAYMDSSNHDVVVAQRSSDSGLWLAPTIELGDEEPYDGAFGFYLNQLVVDGRTVLLTYRIFTREALRDVVVRTLD